MKKSFLSKIALALIVVLLVGCFSGCKSEVDDSMNSALFDPLDKEEEQKPSDHTDDDTPSEEEQKPADSDQQNNSPSETPKEEPTQPDVPKEETPSEDLSAKDEPAEEPKKEDEETPVFEEEQEIPFSMEDALKVVSFNIRAGWYGKTLNDVARLLKEVDGDLVGLQEVDCYTTRSTGGNQVQTLAEKAGYPYFYFAPCIYLDRDKNEKAPADANVNAVGSAILSKYPIKSSEIIWPSVQADGLRNFSRHEIDVNGKTVTFYNCHLDFDEGHAQYKEVQDRYMVKDQYAVCVGDFNETMDELFGHFDEEHFYSFAFGEGMNSPYTRKGKQVIDHIIVTKDTISWYDEEVKNGYYDVPHNGTSDHNLVYGYINLLD